VVEKLLEMDKINAIAASRLAKPFTEWRLFDAKRRNLMKACLEKILAEKPSPNMFEICTKSLKEE
jgi:aminopeptidase N|tara:strand:- start:3115 stop:3309 length:195 start_codon:yes stop_codon:yes gene_type:complete